ncbi:MAG: MtrB/PioB family decaheme-associated outer membrane protein, partial [Myxococcota bacterium]
MAALALLVTLSAGAAGAESTGNPLHSDGLVEWRARDDRGLTLLQDHRLRTPTGLLYPYPREPARTRALGGSWQARAWGALGVFFDAGDEDEARFERYTDWDDGLFVSGLRIELWNVENGGYLEFGGVSVGRDDQAYSLEAGRYGQFRLRGSFRRVPRSFANDARVLFSGVGGDLLTLPPGLTPGDNTAAEIGAAVQATGESGLSLKRDHSSVLLELWPRAELKLFARYGFEDRDGTRPFGLAFMLPNLSPTLGGAVETAEPIDDQTQTVSAGLHYGGERVQGNLMYQGSFYRNDKDTLTVENPFRVGAGPIIARARFSLAPDSDWHNVKGDLALGLPMQTRLTTTVSWSTLRQDDDLVPPTVNDVTFGAIDLNDWNSGASLSRSKADARIDTLLVDARLQTSPIRGLRIRTRVRYFDEDNDTRYTARNPITGELGYIIEDGGLAAVFGSTQAGVFQPAVAGSDFRFRSIPYGKTKLTYEAGASLRALSKTTVELRFERERFDREFQERERTRESRLRASVRSRDLKWATLHLSYELHSRDGSDFDLDTTAPFFTSSLPGFTGTALPRSLAQFRRPNLADRDEEILNLRANFLLGETGDLILTARRATTDYGTDYGLKRDRRGTLSLEWSFQPSPRASLHAYTTLERQRRDMASIKGVPIGSDPNAGSAAYPLANTWASDSDSRSLGLGAGG